MRIDLKGFLDDNKKLYINSNTGKGKTLVLSLLALLFIDLFPEYTIIANFGLNIFDKKTKKSKCIYSKFGLLPFSELKKGKFLVLIDDFIAVKKDLQNFGSILATLSRKLNILVYISLHYYTHLSLENRMLFNYELIPTLFKIKNGKLTESSKVNIECYETSSLELHYKFNLFNLLELVKGNYTCNNVFVKGLLYNTYEVVSFSNERLIIQEVAKWSKNLDDIEQNISLITKSRTRYKYLLKEVKKFKKQ